MNFRVFSVGLLFVLSLLGGCTTSQKYSEFVQDITFSRLQTYSYAGVETDGARWKDAQVEVLNQLGDEVLSAEMDERGFRYAESGADFYVMTRWVKAVTLQDNYSKHSVGLSALRQDTHEQAGGLALRCRLSVEVYEGASGRLFWKKEMPDVFDAIDFTESRVRHALRRAIRGFPECVERDPNLPDLQNEIINSPSTELGLL